MFRKIEEIGNVFQIWQKVTLAGVIRIISITDWEPQMAYFSGSFKCWFSAFSTSMHLKQHFSSLQNFVNYNFLHIRKRTLQIFNGWKHNSAKFRHHFMIFTRILKDARDFDNNNIFTKKSPFFVQLGDINQLMRIGQKMWIFYY